MDDNTDGTKLACFQTAQLRCPRRWHLDHAYFSQSIHVYEIESLIIIIAAVSSLFKSYHGVNTLHDSVDQSSVDRPSAGCISLRLQYETRYVPEVPAIELNGE